MLYLKSFYYLASACFVVFCFFTEIGKINEKKENKALVFQYSDLTMNSVLIELNQLRKVMSVEEALPLYLTFRELYKEIEAELYFYRPLTWDKINEENTLGKLEKSIFDENEPVDKIQELSSIFMKQLIGLKSKQTERKLDSSQYFLLKYKLCTFHLLEGKDSPIMELNHSEALDSFKVLNLMARFQGEVSNHKIDLENYLKHSIEIIDVEEPESKKTEINSQLIKLYQQFKDAELKSSIEPLFALNYK